MTHQSINSVQSGEPHPPYRVKGVARLTSSVLCFLLFLQNVTNSNSQNGCPWCTVVRQHVRITFNQQLFRCGRKGGLLQFQLVYIVNILTILQGRLAVEEKAKLIMDECNRGDPPSNNNSSLLTNMQQMFFEIIFIYFIFNCHNIK